MLSAKIHYVWRLQKQAINNLFEATLWAMPVGYVEKVTQLSILISNNLLKTKML